jgi:ADP-dependent NAD(P)H-hydrate dehydratase / NAD(P)H-hydrate epimerase
MRVALEVADVRAAEQQAMARLPDGVLMQRAAAGLAAACTELLGSAYGRRVVLAVGSGDNGGDALFAGARLARAGAQVLALCLSDQPHAGGAEALRRSGGRVEAYAGGSGQLLAPGGISPDLVVDGIVGIGGSGGLRPAAAELVGAWESIDPRPLVVAVDLPSGVEADTGRVEGSFVTADVTVAFGVLKPGLLVAPGALAAGSVELVDIGLDGLPGPGEPGRLTVVSLADVAQLLPRPDVESDKYRRGVVGLVTGSPRYPGAGVLSTMGARCGLAGMVRHIGTGDLSHEIVLRFPDVVPGTPAEPGRVQAWVVGSGSGGEPPAIAFDRLLADGVPVLVDADGLRHLPAPADRPDGARLLLTPHAGELSRLIGVDRDQIEADRLRTVRSAARQLQATVLLKGATTVAAEPDGTAYVASEVAPAWLASAGSGDVLGGIAGALLAASTAKEQAGVVDRSPGLGRQAIAAGIVHAAAARLAGPGLVAARLAEAVPRAVANLLTDRDDD